MRWSIIILILFTSCLPEQNYTERTQEASNSATTTTEEDESQNVNLSTTISWLNSGLTTSNLTIDFDNNKTVYLLGDQVHNYLSNSNNFKSDYCLEARYTKSSSNTPKRLRVKLTPGFSNNFSQGKITRFFRVNIGTEVGNNFCDRPTIESIAGNDMMIQAGDSDYDGDVDGTDVNLVFHPSDVCVGCLNIITSSSFVIYKNNNSGTKTISADDYLERIKTSSISYSKLVLRIDMNGGSGDGTSSCSNNTCLSQGFDCCVQGQCVNEASYKAAGINADPGGFSEAEQERLTDPNWYKRYPQFYYICLEQPGTTPGDDDDDDDDEDPTGDADERLLELTSDNTCLEELDAATDSDPFHIDFLSGNPTCAECGGDATCTLEVMERLYENCGCSATDVNSAIQTCPAYTYNPIYQTGTDGLPTTNLIAFECITPNPDQTPPPFSDLEVSVNARAAPHRFFNENNIEVDPTAPLPSGVSETQEGTEFQYLDNFYIFPRNEDFNMNSILGQMNIQLTKARPAIKIDLEFDRQYLIATRDGSYISCPTCARDSWFGNFSPFPIAQDGVGLQAVGYTTRRDTFETNTTLGNYEDTKFSRACYLPPTMLPFSHSANPSEQQQRLNRLEAQAALYVNGYQKDWFGFNRGALIGSFDGVTWFAIGKGRIVRATSNKLFLAINAPFADLASPIDHTVSVQEYDFTSTAPVYDYLPEEEINSSTQNEAGSCQFWHQCETDSDCITKLGWEYSCADVSLQQTSWPSFEPLGATEESSTLREGTIAEFLQQAQLPPGSSTQRCVYRGAGSPCRVDYESISDENIRKHFTCAPNFYCERLTTSEAFNAEVARYGRPLDELVESKNHFYGMDANLLGRPKHYINEGYLSTLPETVQTTLESNFLLTETSGAGNFGLCRPGKKLPDYSGLSNTQNWEYSKQHAAPDIESRTDFISQISSCNSALFTDLRYSSCPMLDKDGNYVHTQDDFINNNFTIDSVGSGLSKIFVTERLSYAQNACGLESLSDEIIVSTSTDANTLDEYSAFRSIEAPPLSSSNTVIEETLARDACLRKAGAVCHTDLDCSPNRLMASAVDLVDPSFFGNDAEKTYYEEYLICGQAQEEPTAGASDYYKYEMSNNRCCRPVGQSLTMYSEDSPNAEESAGLQSHVFGSLNPTSPTRYSRYSSAEATINSSLKQSNLIRPSANTDDVDNDKNLDNSVNITGAGQWTTIHDTASKTCCGGSWVRKFEDGTNDWSQTNRLNFTLSNFQCLNYRSGLYRTENAAAFGLRQADLESDKVNFCPDGAQTSGGCIQHSIAPINNFVVVKPTLDETIKRQEITTNDEEMAGLWASNLWTYGRLPAANGTNVGDAGFSPFLDWNNDIDSAAARYISVRLPSFITFNTIGDLRIQMTDPLSGNPNSKIECDQEIDLTTSPATYYCSGFSPGTNQNAGLCYGDSEYLNGTHNLWSPLYAGAVPSASTCGSEDSCCYTYNTTTRVLSVAYPNSVVEDPNAYGNYDMYLTIDEWFAVGTLGYEGQYVLDNSFGGVMDIAAIDGRRSAEPGNALYYLKKLAKFEYLGIPQMTYEPIYCNDNYQNLVPGIFLEELDGSPLENVVDFLNHPRTFIDNNTDTPWNSDSAVGGLNADSLNINLVATQELVDKPQIFSDNQFKCCLELGSAIDANANPSMCCSGFSADDEELKSEAILDGENVAGKFFCKLPSGTDLNVYFNKFVSGEGLSSDLGVNPLESEDFDAVTGEPMLESDIISKLTALGERFCANNATRRGAIVGNFTPQPVGSQSNTNIKLNSIVDSNNDKGSANSTQQGAQIYNLGFKWNHHIYCDIGNQ